jgi:hypothetical protein
MSLNTAQLQYLAEQGMSLDQVIELSKRGDIRSDPTAADRMRRHRAKPKDVTRNVTDEPPIDKDHTPLSDPNGSVAEATGLDPGKQLFDLGPALMVRTAGMTEKQARTYIGKLRSDHGESQALIAVLEALRLNISNPVEWLPKRCKSQAPPGSNRQALYRQADRIQHTDIAA